MSHAYNSHAPLNWGKTMKIQLLFTTILITTLSFIAPVRAQEKEVVQVFPDDYYEPTKEEIVNACVQNKAETLPNPYTDVEPTHWAYKAVLSMYYCGAFRQATPQILRDQFIQSDAN